MEILIFIVIAIIALILSIVIVPQQTMVVIERLGKYNRILGPGLNFKIPIIERVAGRESIRIRQLDVPVETKMILEADCSTSPRLKGIFGSMKNQFKN